MAYTTRWSVDSTTNELVFVPVEFFGNNAADMLPLFDKGITGSAVLSVEHTGTGLYTIHLDQSWPFLLGADLDIFSPSGSFQTLKVNVANDSVVNADPASVKIQIIQNQAGVDTAVDLPTTYTLQGFLVFRNRLAGMLWGS